jgi:iron complex transport system permease protein
MENKFTVIPHMMRLTFGSDHPILIGASFLLTADTLVRTIFVPIELPVGVVTAFCGVPYFICLLRRRTST